MYQPHDDGEGPVNKLERQAAALRALGRIEGFKAELGRLASARPPGQEGNACIGCGDSHTKTCRDLR